MNIVIDHGSNSGRCHHQALTTISPGTVLLLYTNNIRTVARRTITTQTIANIVERLVIVNGNRAIIVIISSRARGIGLWWRLKLCSPTHCINESTYILIITWRRRKTTIWWVLKQVRLQNRGTDVQRSWWVTLLLLRLQILRHIQRWGGCLIRIHHHHVIYGSLLPKCSLLLGWLLILHNHSKVLLFVRFKRVLSI